MVVFLIVILDLLVHIHIFEKLRLDLGGKPFQYQRRVRRRWEPTVHTKREFVNLLVFHRSYIAPVIAVDGVVVEIIRLIRGEIGDKDDIRIPLVNLLHVDLRSAA